MQGPRVHRRGSVTAQLAAAAAGAHPAETPAVFVGAPEVAELACAPGDEYSRSRFVVGPTGEAVDRRPPAAPPVAAPKVLGRHARELQRERKVRNRIAKGETLYASDGTGYVASNVTWNALTLRLAIPKIRGKAARKALKRQRQRLANQKLRRQGELEARQEGQL